MSKYTLTYFEAKGRAETCRLIFAAAGQEVSVEKRRIGSCNACVAGMLLPPANEV